MIGKLSGIIDSFETDHLILDVQGVGYVVYASAALLSRIGVPGDRASLRIDTHVREDRIQLFGFMDIAEQHWFRLLTSVQGVGSKAALAILSACPAADLGLVIAAQDKAALTRADGVGPKLAARILTELKDKAGSPSSSPSLSSSSARSQDVQGGGESAQTGALERDALSALINLGYQRSEAYALIARLLRSEEPESGWSLDALVRQALKELSS